MLVNEHMYNYVIICSFKYTTKIYIHIRNYVPYAPIEEEYKYINFIKYIRIIRKLVILVSGGF